MVDGYSVVRISVSLGVPRGSFLTGNTFWKPRGIMWISTLTNFPGVFPIVSSLIVSTTWTSTKPCVLCSGIPSSGRLAFLWLC